MNLCQFKIRLNAARFCLSWRLFIKFGGFEALLLEPEICMVYQKRDFEP